MTSAVCTEPRKRRRGAEQCKGEKATKEEHTAERPVLSSNSSDWFELSAETVAAMSNEFLGGIQDVTTVLFLEAVASWMFGHSPEMRSLMPDAITEWFHVYLLLLWAYVVLDKAFLHVPGFRDPCVLVYSALWRSQAHTQTDAATAKLKPQDEDAKDKSKSDTKSDKNDTNDKNEAEDKCEKRTERKDAIGCKMNELKHLLYSVLASCAGVSLGYFGWLSLLRNTIYRQGTGELRQIIDEALIWDRPASTEPVLVTFAITVLPLVCDYLVMDAMQWLRVSATMQVATLYTFKLSLFKHMSQSFGSLTLGNVAYNSTVPLCFGRRNTTEMTLTFAPFAAVSLHFILRRFVFCY